MPQGQLAGPKDATRDSYTGRTKFDNAGNGWVYVKAHGDLTAYVAYLLSWDSTGAVSRALTGASAEYGTIIIPQEAVASGAKAWMQFRGDCSALLANDTYLVNEALLVFDATIIGSNAVIAHTALTHLACVKTVVTAAPGAPFVWPIYLFGREVLTTT
jgi:hypothetical protein